MRRLKTKSVSEFRLRQKRNYSKQRAATQGEEMLKQIQSLQRRPGHWNLTRPGYSNSVPVAQTSRLPGYCPQMGPYGTHISPTWGPYGPILGPYRILGYLDICIYCIYIYIYIYMYTSI